MVRISIPTQTDTEEVAAVMEELCKLGEVCQKVLKHYPSTWNALEKQYLSRRSHEKNNTLSNKLFMKKLEVQLLIDEEKRR